MRNPTLTDLGFLFGVCQHQRDHLEKVKQVLSKTVAENQREGLVGDEITQTANEVMQLVLDIKGLNWWMTRIESWVGQARIDERKRLRGLKEPPVSKAQVRRETLLQAQSEGKDGEVTLGHAKRDDDV